MPYAGNAVISQSPIPGGITITEAQYLEALEGLLEGKVISITNGFNVDYPTHQEPPTFTKEDGDPLYFVSKQLLATRLEPGEVTPFLDSVDAEGPKFRMVYDSVPGFVSDEVMFAVIHALLAISTSTDGRPNFDRADELLAPEEQTVPEDA